MESRRSGIIFVGGKRKINFARRKAGEYCSAADFFVIKLVYKVSARFLSARVIPVIIYIAAFGVYAPRNRLFIRGICYGHTEIAYVYAVGRSVYDDLFFTEFRRAVFVKTEFALPRGAGSRVRAFAVKRGYIVDESNRNARIVAIGKRNFDEPRFVNDVSRLQSSVIYRRFIIVVPRRVALRLYRSGIHGDNVRQVAARQVDRRSEREFVARGKGKFKPFTAEAIGGKPVGVLNFGSGRAYAPLLFGNDEGFFSRISLSVFGKRIDCEILARFDEFRLFTRKKFTVGRERGFVVTRFYLPVGKFYLRRSGDFYFVADEVVIVYFRGFDRRRFGASDLRRS